MKGITSGFDISSAFYTFSLVKRIVLTRIIFILSFFPIFLYSQDKEIKDMGSNMVPNNSFESIKKIPTHWYMNGEDFNNIMSDWTSPTQASPDIYTLSTKVPATWKEKGFGDQQAFKGNNMVGLTMFGCKYGKPHCREYVQVRLKEALVIGQQYYFEMWVKHLPKSLHINNIGVFFAPGMIKKNFDIQISCKPQVSVKKIVKTPGKEWAKLSGVFTSQTSATYLIIGNFLTDSLTKTEEPPSESLNYAYYYVDDVSLKKIPPFITPPSEEGTFEDCCIQKGDTVILKNIYFDFDKSVLRPESYVELNKLLRVLHENPYMIITITGHTDIVGKYSYNTWLSRNRAQAVKQFLMDNSIEEERLKVLAMSYTKPAATNKTDEGRQLNRRVELVIIDK